MINLKLIQTREFEVDDAIAQHIIELNNKGYQTEYCCSGHVGGESPGYILFDTTTSSYIKQFVIYAPGRWYFNFMQDKRVGVYMRLHDRPISEKLIEVRLKSLQKWIDELPIRKNPYSKLYTKRGDAR